MKIEELQVLLDQFAYGKKEDQTHEWKREWWNFKKNSFGKGEFRRDVAAMANGEADARTRYIVIGAKDGDLFHSPLPCDEAELQVILDYIQPRPSVSFVELELGDPGSPRTLTVVSINPPFDRPYVLKEDNRNIIYIRTGTSISTATRTQIDRCYLKKIRKPELKIGWLTWSAKQLPSISDAEMVESLRLPRPRRTIESLKDDLLGTLRAAEERAKIAGYPSMADVERFANSIDLFIGQFSRIEFADYWCEKHLDLFVDFSQASLWIENFGNAPATAVKVRIGFPTCIFSRDPGKNVKPAGWIPMPQIRLTPSNRAPKSLSPGPRAPTDLAPQHLSHLALANLNPSFGDRLSRPTEGSSFYRDRRMAVFWADRIVHTHTLRIPNALCLAISPLLPTPPDAVIEAEVFCEEFESREVQKLKLETSE